jgi:hypothetical protein
MRRVEEGGAPGVVIKSGQFTAEILPGEAKQARKEAARRAVGSVEGILASVSFAGTRPVFSVRDHITQNLTPCYFDADRFYNLVIAGLRRRVAVSGIVTERPNGEISSVTDVDEIYIFPLRHELPQPGELLGLDPDLTEGMPVEEWIEALRG